MIFSMCARMWSVDGGCLAFSNIGFQTVCLVLEMPGPIQNPTCPSNYDLIMFPMGERMFLISRQRISANVHPKSSLGRPAGRRRPALSFEQMLLTVSLRGGSPRSSSSWVIPQLGDETPLVIRDQHWKQFHFDLAHVDTMGHHDR